MATKTKKTVNTSSFDVKAVDGDLIAEKIEKLVRIPSPTGFTGKVREFLVKNAEKLGIRHRVTKKGAVVYMFGPQDIEGTFFAAHVDTLGGIVTAVNKNNVKIAPVGGFPALYVLGEICTVHHRSGGEYTGTFLPDNPAVHVNGELDKLVPSYTNCSLRMDVAAGQKLEDIISVGDFVSFDCGFRYVNGNVNSRHLDDKASAGIFLYLSEILKKHEKELKTRISFFFNITEETGQGIAAAPEGDDLIVVDMGVVGGETAGDERCVSICAKDSAGIYDYDLTNHLIDLAAKYELPYKVDVFPHYGSDGSVLLKSCSDTRVALIGQGVAASHGYERTNVEALKATASLILAHIFG